ncbi:MAG: hypothetical protein EXR09_00885 [Acetobacteraceae bacterium]|nr:hypothetical protein [Acetobacteraceae bacterium]
MIDISAYLRGVTDQASFDVWAITHITVTGNDLVVDLGAGDTIKLAGVANIAMVTYANLDFVV